MHLRRLSFFAAVLLANLSARADSFKFQFSGPSDRGAGTFTAVGTGNPGEYIVTSIAGTMNGLAISSLISPNVYPPDAPNDNLFFFPATAVTTYFDDCGVSFALSDGTDINLYYGTYSSNAGALGPGYILIEGVAEAPGTITSLTISPATILTPEPLSITLVGTAIIGLLAAFRTLRRANV